MQDYYAFGMQMPGRKSSGGYRYGFNGMEKDDDLNGASNSYTTLHRIYDSRLGRWLSVDPEADEYPDESPYSAMESNPISETDPDGDCPWCIAFIKGAVQEYATQVIMNVAQGKSLRESFTDVDGREILKSAVIDGLTLGVGGLIGKARVAVNLVNATDKIVDAEKAAVKANKVANTTEKVSKIEKNVAKAVNKNSNKYVGKQSVYEIKKDGKLVKYGKADATNVSKTTGQPKRLQTQVDKMQKANPNSKVEGKVLETHDNISTKDIKKIETKYIQDHTNKTGSLPPGNQGHPGVKPPNN